MRQFTQVFQDATAAVPSGYFALQIAGGDPVYRERVYCYELYHKMRCVWPADTEFYLNGEVDKVAHPILTELGAADMKPDFLVHKPGDMQGNYAIIEVKTCRTDNAGICKDITTLSRFARELGYKRAMFLVFGSEGNQNLRKRISRIASKFDKLPPIELWFHRVVGYPAEHITDVN